MTGSMSLTDNGPLVKKRAGRSVRIEKLMKSKLQKDKDLLQKLLDADPSMRIAHPLKYR